MSKNKIRVYPLYVNGKIEYQVANDGDGNPSHEVIDQVRHSAKTLVELVSDEKRIIPEDFVMEIKYSAP